MRCGCGAARMGAVEEAFFTPSARHCLSLCRKTPSSMHASLPVCSERLHDCDDPRVLAQPVGGKHAPVDVPWGRATEEILLAQEPFDSCELAFSLVVATDHGHGALRDLVGSGGWSPHRMLLGTGRYQVGSGGCSPHRMLLRMNMIELRRLLLFALGTTRKRLPPQNA